MKCLSFLVRAGFLVLVILAGYRPSAAMAAATAPKVLYETHFEPTEGFDPGVTLIGQGGWVGFGSGGNGLVTNFFPGRGQNAFVGFVAPTNNGEFLNVWRPVNHVPGPTNPPVVHFSALMSVEDSTTANRDDFRWSVYNVRGDRLLTLDFDNDSLGINYLLDDDKFVGTGHTFTNSHAYRLEMVVDFAANQWSASLDGLVVADKVPVTTKNSPRDFGDLDAVWAIRTPGSPGDNFMVFDDYRVVAEEGSTRERPRLEALGLVRPGQFLVRCHGTPGFVYVVEGGPDFQTWVSLKTNTMPSDGFFDHLDQGGAAYRFYRAVER